MTNEEYTHLQERLTKLLHKPTAYSGNRREAYKDGILAAKSMLHDEFENHMKETPACATQSRLTELEKSLFFD